jgi:autotransporter-associated beta strand protein
MKSRTNRFLAIASLAGSCLATSASAQTLTKANNTTALNEAGSWVENSAPTSSNVLLFDSTVGAGVTASVTTASGGNLSVNGLQVTSVTNNSMRISSNGASTLTLGSGGVDMSTAGGNLRIDPAVTLSTGQTWSIASGRILNLATKAITGGGYTAQVTGAGSLAFDIGGTATYGSELEVDSTIFRVNAATSDVTLTNANNSFTNLSLFNGTARFSSIAAAGFDSAAGAFSTGTLGGSNTSGLFYYTGNTGSTNRNFTVDRRSAASGILVSTAGQTLTISGTINHNGGNDTGVKDNAFRVGGDGNLTLSGVINDNSNASFTTSLAKEGIGTLTLSNANTFQGGVAVAAGTLLVNNTTGSGTGTGVVTVSGAGTVLKGDGTIGGATSIQAGAIHASGNSVGIQKFTNNLTYEDASIFAWDIAKTNPGSQTRGTDYDAVNVTSVLAGLDGADAGTTTNAIFRIVIGDANFSDTFWASNNHSWTDIFTAADGSTVKSDWAGIFGGGFEYYNGSTQINAPTTGSFNISGNTLTWSAVPEPTSALAGLLITAGLLRRRRRA